MGKNTHQKEALQFLNTRPLLRVAPLYAFDRGQVDILAMGEDGLLMKDVSSGIVFLCADSDKTALALLGALDDCEIMVFERVNLDSHIRARYGFTWHTPVYSTVYEKKTPVPVDPDFVLKTLTMADFPLVRAHYDLIGDEGLAHHLARGDMLGGFVQDEMVGFIGRHEEGSLGMLYVLPQHRRQGYAWQLEGHMINRVLAAGEKVFGQVILGNDISLALQRKIGMTLCEEPVSWMGK